MSTVACPECGAHFDVVEESEVMRLLRRPASVDETLRERDG